MLLKVSALITANNILQQGDTAIDTRNTWAIVALGKPTDWLEQNQVNIW